jgi:hypothetical protein
VVEIQRRTAIQFRIQAPLIQSDDNGIEFFGGVDKLGWNFMQKGKNLKSALEFGEKNYNPSFFKF